MGLLDAQALLDGPAVLLPGVSAPAEPAPGPSSGQGCKHLSPTIQEYLRPVQGKLGWRRGISGR